MRTLLKPGLVLGLVGLLAVTATLPASARMPATVTAAAADTDAQYVVLFKQQNDDAQARDAIAVAGGTVLMVNSKIGYALVKSAAADFAAALEQSGSVDSVALNAVVGVAPKTVRRSDDVERLLSDRAAAKNSGTVAGAPDAAAQRGSSASSTGEPLADRQWDMRQIDATPAGSYAVQRGNPEVLVGVIDTGIDGSHPDIAPNFDAARSRNFVTDMPEIDGIDCEHPPACVDPADEDDDGHGTHVASTIASPINNLGIAGVAPNVHVVNIRAGQDSGYFFLQPTLEALTYAGDIGVDVVNMSFYTDPWLYNCTANPADSPAEQQQQRTIRKATQRAINYAVAHGVLPVAAMGNEATDLNNPTSDSTSPDYPTGSEKVRVIDNSCITVPTETNGVLAVSSTGPSTRKAYYSNYGTEQTDVAAPGGDYYDTPGNTGDPTNLVLAAYPQRLAELNGDLNPDGTPNNPFVVRDCDGAVCAYYQYLQGTSMAAPHAVGVAALIVSQFGRSRGANGLGLNPLLTRGWLMASATRHPCPQPRTYHYALIGGDGSIGETDATCEGPLYKNGFYGTGIVNALRAVNPRG